MSTPEAKGVHPLVEPMSMAEFFEEAKRLGVRMLGTPEETCAALDAKDAEIERLTAERDALRAKVGAWQGLYRRAINEANGLTNYVEDRPELRSAERRLEAIEAQARAALAQGKEPSNG